MVLDKPEHRDILLELIDKAHFPGVNAEQVVELKAALRAATIAKPKSDKSK